MFSATTNNIQVSVMPVYIDEKSDPENHMFFWAYRVSIENLGKKTVQLVSRYWHITNAVGQIEEVKGAGVVGEQPILKPGDRFEYTSGCPLNTSSGIMRGCYVMTFEDQSEIEVMIPPFSLDLPDDNPVYN